MMSGFIRIERSLWSHPFFADEPMSEREAWAWMIAKAAWEPTQHRVGRDMLAVPRGTFMITLRELQKTFRWKSDKKVRTFLSRLEQESMILRSVVGAANAPKTHVTICEYEEYQSGGRTKDARGVSGRTTGHDTDAQQDARKSLRNIENMEGRTHNRTRGGRTEDAVKEQGNKETKEPNGSYSPPPTPSADECRVVVDLWNAMAGKADLKTCRLTDKRIRSCRPRLREHGLEEITRAIDRIPQSSFLLGHNDRGWKADFDFFLRPDSITKILEGKYDDRQSRQPPCNGGTKPKDGFERALDRRLGVGETEGAEWPS